MNAITINLSNDVHIFIALILFQRQFKLLSVYTILVRYFRLIASLIMFFISLSDMTNL